MKWLIGILVLAIAIIVGLTIYLQPNSFIGCQTTPLAGSEGCEAVDAIVVISGGDTVARTQAGIDLYKNGWAPNIIFSGAAQDKSGPSNAEAMRQQAIYAGIDPRAIIIDEEAETTQQNAQNVKSIFEQNGYEKVILATSGYHQRRATLEFTKNNPGVEIMNYPLTQDKDWSTFWWWTSPRGWWLAGGEFLKVVAFYFGAAR